MGNDFMHKRLEKYSARQCRVFLKCYELTLHNFDPDAIHDLRVAIKRLNAVFDLLERMFPDQLIGHVTQGGLHELFRLSGRMRDAQVQQQLVADLSQTLNAGFNEYQYYLKNAEKKAVGKFQKYIQGYDAKVDLVAKQEMISSLLGSTDGNAVKLHIFSLVGELLATARNMHSEQESDEHLHEIRRKLKHCLYLLLVFSKKDDAFPDLKTILKTLNKANKLLGDWHDRLIAMQTLEKFISKQNKKETTGENRYQILHEHLAKERYLLQVKILKLLEKEMKI